MSARGDDSRPHPSAGAADDELDDVDSLLQAVAAAPAVPLSVPPGEGAGLGPGDSITERYAVEQLLGRGGMGEVYRAHDTQLKRPVAIKLHLREPRPGGLDRLLREAQALARVNHPHVVAIFDVGTWAERLYIAMEYVPGGNARQWAKASERGWPAIRELFVQAGRGLEAAHEAGLVHRDFKPDNVLVGDDGRARVADFGLVASYGGVSTEVSVKERLAASPGPRTRTGAVAGTPAYMAPEQWAGGVVDARADQFAFCVALHEFVYGARPERSGSVEDLGGGSGERRPLRAMPGEPKVSGVPSEVLAALDRGLSPAPADRFPTMGALLRELEPARRGRRRRRLAGALGLVGLVGVAGAAWWSTAPPHTACHDGQTELRDTWDDARRARVRRALVSVEAERGASVADAIIPRMDDYARAWLDHRQRACASFDVAESSAPFDRRLACLRRRRIGLDAAVALLERPDAALLERADGLVPDASALARCEDDEALAAAIAPPDDPVVAAEVAALRDELARWPALDAAGRYADAAERYVAVLERARATEYAPVMASALFIYGEALVNLGRSDAAEPLLREAYLTARAAGDDFLAYQAAATLLHVVGFDLGRPQEALSWGRHAEVLLPRVPRGSRVRGMVFNAMASIHGQLGDLEAAEASQRLAVEEARVSEEGGWEHAGTMIGLASILTDRARFDEAQPLAERGLAIMIERRGPEHPGVGVAHTKLAPILDARGRIEEGLEHRRRALEIFERAYPEGHRRVGAAANNYGDALIAAGRLEEGLRAIERGVEIFGALAPGGRRHMFVTKVLANALAEAGRVDEAIERYEQVLRGQDDPVLRAQTLNDLGDTVRAEGRVDEAIERFEEAIEVLEEAHGDQHPELALPRANLGYSVLTAGRFAEAEANFLAARRAQAQQDPEDPDRLYAQTGLGIAQLAQGHGRDAVETLERAERLARSPDVDPDEAALARLALIRALRRSGRPGAQERIRGLEAGLIASPSREPMEAQLSAWLDRDEHARTRTDRAR